MLNYSSPSAVQDSPSNRWARPHEGNARARCATGAAIVAGGVTAADERFPEVPGYRVLEQIGAGGMGAVYLAQRAGASRPCALKVMRHALGRHEPNVRRFWREVRVLMLHRHPGVVDLVDAGRTTDGRLYLETRLVGGRDLFAIIQRSRALSLELWLTVAEQLLSALASVHSLTGPEGQPLGLVHRDLKPENVMVDGSGRVVILDFGLARASTPDATRITRPGQVMGTPKYMAPEQIVAPEAVGPRTDQYAAAVVLYHAAVGRTVGADLPNGDDRCPIPELWAQLMEPAWRPLSELAPQIPGKVDRVFQRAMAVEPGERFGSVARFRDELFRVAGRDAAPLEALGRHVARLFPDEARDPSRARADATAVSSRPTVAGSDGAEGTAHAVAPGACAGGASRAPGAGRQAARRGGLVGVAAVAGVVLVALFGRGGDFGASQPSGEGFGVGRRAADSAASRGREQPSVTRPEGATEPRATPRAASGGASRPELGAVVGSRTGDPKAGPEAEAAPRGSSPPVRAPRVGSSSGGSASPDPGARAKPRARRPRPAGGRRDRPPARRTLGGSADRSPPTSADVEGASAENSHPPDPFATVAAAVDRGDETEAARALRALEGRVPRPTWACILEGLKTKRAEDVLRACR